MYSFLESVSSKVTLTTDIWTSDHQNLAYICLTAHFIDENWELQNKIIAYRHIEYSHDGDTLFKFIRDLVLEWNIDKKLFAMVVDNASSNDVMVRKWKFWLQERSLLSLEGSLFHVRCSAHILNLVVQDGLKVIQGLLEKIRLTIRYLRNFTYAKQKFDTAANQFRLNGPKILPIDVPHRWNSTYLMLDAAISMRKALERLVDLDKNYHHIPSREEWEVATMIKKCLEGFYNETKHFTGRNFPTSNVFFPDVCDLQFDLSNWEKNNIDYLCALAGPMKEKLKNIGMNVVWF
ncbi:putative ribonuclease H-like superfamily [Helianthus debilis subsp. tardiflorus]